MMQLHVDNQQVDADFVFHIDGALWHYKNGAWKQDGWLVNESFEQAVTRIQDEDSEAV